MTPRCWLWLLLGIAALAAITLSAFGCSWSGARTVKNPNPSAGPSSDSPVSRSDPEQETLPQSARKKPPSNDHKPVKTEATNKSHQREEDLIRDIAMDLAKDAAAVEKIKICYSKKKDEWWITLYEDAGHSLDLKQYIWSRNHDKVEPFLVVSRIARNVLKQHLAQPERDGPCTVFNKTKDGWKPTVVSPTNGEPEGAPGKRKSKKRSSRNRHESDP